MRNCEMRFPMCMNYGATTNKQEEMLNKNSGEE